MRERERGRWQLCVVITVQGDQGYTRRPGHTHTHTQSKEGVVGSTCVQPRALLVSKASAAKWQKKSKGNDVIDPMTLQRSGQVLGSSSSTTNVWRNTPEGMLTDNLISKQYPSLSLSHYCTQQSQADLSLFCRMFELSVSDGRNVTFCPICHTLQGFKQMTINK